jgi:hypothetical protein
VKAEEFVGKVLGGTSGLTSHPAGGHRRPIRAV